MFEGGCFCQEVRYAVDAGAYQSVDSHCTLCRRSQAAPQVTWIVVPADEFRYRKTLPTALRSCANGTRYFCRACGTHAACINAEHAAVVDVAVGSIDCPEPFIPPLQIFEDTRLSWLARSHDGQDFLRCDKAVLRFDTGLLSRHLISCRAFKTPAHQQFLRGFPC